MHPVAVMLLFSCALAASNSEFEELSLNAEDAHKSVWPVDTSEIIGYILIFIISALANSAGIGGGPVMTPILVLLFAFQTHTAIPLAQVIVFGGALMAIGLRMPVRHPTRDRPLIFYQLIMLVQAPLLFGTSLGALLNTLFPAWLIEILLTSVLVFMCYNTFKKGFMLYNKESKQSSNERLLPGQGSELKPLSDTERSHNNHPALIPYDTARLDPIAEEEKKMVPLKEVLIIFGIWIIVVLYTLMKGGAAPSIVGIQKCSAAYFGLTGGFVSILMLIFIYTLKLVIKDTELKESLAYNWDEHDLKWTKKNAVTLGVVSIAVGVLAGMIGIAGGLILIPIMLAYGIRPEQAAATSSFMIFFTSSTAILQFFSSNLVHPQYGIVVLCIAFVGSFTGVTIVKKLIEKVNRPSIIVLILGSIMALAGVVIPIYGTTKIIESFENGTGEFGFHSLCG